MLGNHIATSNPAPRSSPLIRTSRPQQYSVIPKKMQKKCELGLFFSGGGYKVLVLLKDLQNLYLKHLKIYLKLMSNIAADDV